MIGVCRCLCVCLVALITSACLPVYKVRDGAATATLEMIAPNDSINTTNRGIYIWVFDDLECNRNPAGMFIGSNRSNSDLLVLSAFSIEAGKQFVFTGTYLDSRFAQNRKCQVTAGFTPEPGKHYKAVLKVEDNVARCFLGIYENNMDEETPVPINMPKYVCVDSGMSDRENGRPLYINWRFTM